MNIELTPFVWSQILPCIAFCFDIASIQFKSRKRIILCFAVSALCLSLHYFLLQSLITALLAGISFTRFIISYFSTHRAFFFFYIALAVLVLILTYENLGSFLPFFGVTFATIASFQTHDKRVRQFMMITTTFWLTTNIVLWSPMAIIIESFFLGSNFIGYWRFYIKPQKR